MPVYSITRNRSGCGDIRNVARGRVNGNEGTLCTEFAGFARQRGRENGRNPTAVLVFPLMFQLFFSAEAPENDYRETMASSLRVSYVGQWNGALLLLVDEPSLFPAVGFCLSRPYRAALYFVLQRKLRISLVAALLRVSVSDLIANRKLGYRFRRSPGYRKFYEDFNRSLKALKIILVVF